MGIKMTATWVKKVTTQADREEFYDSVCQGLCLRLSAKGTKTWRFRYTADGKRKRVGLGQWPAISLHDARERAFALSDQLRGGTDPQASIEEARFEREAMPTVADFCHVYIERYARPKKRSWREDERYLTKDVIPYIGTMKMDVVKRSDLVALMDHMTDRGAVTGASRMYACVRRMFRFAVERGLLESTPAQFIRIEQGKTRENVLTDEQIRDLWHRTTPCNSRSDEVNLALRLVLLTVARRAEIAGMPKAEVDRKKMLWTLPADRAKNGVENITPLTRTALGIIEVASRPNHEYVFQSRVRASAHILPSSLTKAVHRMFDGAFTVHDLRRTAATRISGLGFERIVVKKLLNHVDNSVDGIYDRYNYLAEKRAALEAWEAELLRIVD